MEHTTNILIVDDDKNIVFLVMSALEDKYKFFSANKIQEALKILKTNVIDIILLDISLGTENGLDAIVDLKNESKFSEIIMITASNTIKDVVKAIKLGAFDYIIKPFSIEELSVAIDKASKKISMDQKMAVLEEDIGRLKKFEDLVYKSPSMGKIIEKIKTVAPLDSTVLIKGESGTGKELVARAIHNNSKRKDSPFIAINCASIPDNLFEAEMFGFEKGAFTSAVQTKKGKFEIAEGGTIFLDELSSLRANGQASLLRAIERKEIERVGSTRKIHLDIRILAATNQNLLEMIKEGKFREDLYYRLNVIPIDIPSLKNRKEDIEVLVHHFIQKYNFILGKNLNGIEDEALKALFNHDWPGNVRELENLIERLVALGENDTTIKHADLPLEIIIPENPLLNPEEGLTLEGSKKQFERELIIAALERAHWNRKLTAKMLGIHINTLLKKMNELKIVQNHNHTAV